MFSCCFHLFIALCVIVTKPNRSFERGNCLPEGSPSSKEATHIASDGQSSCQYHFTVSSPHWPVVSASWSVVDSLDISAHGGDDWVPIKPMSSKVLERREIRKMLRIGCHCFWNIRKWEPRNSSAVGRKALWIIYSNNNEAA